MARPRDPVQRHIIAVHWRDRIVRDDASDLDLQSGSTLKTAQRQLEAMLPGVDYPANSSLALKDDPVGRRIGRVAFNPCIERYWIGTAWTGGGPEPHRLPASQSAISRFHRQQILLYGSDPQSGESDGQTEIVIGFSINDHARVSELLFCGGGTASVLVASCKLAAACAKFEKVHRRVSQTGRNIDEWQASLRTVEVALNGAARVAADVALTSENKPKGIQTIAFDLAEVAESFRKARPCGRQRRVASARRVTQSAASALLILTTGKLDRNRTQFDRDVRKLPVRLQSCASAVANQVEQFVGDVLTVDTPMIYRLLMARRLDVALKAHPWLAAPHPSFPVSYGYIGGHAVFAELERVALIAKHMVERQKLASGSVLRAGSIRQSLSCPEETNLALTTQNVPGQYLDLGVYHSDVTNAFIRHKNRWIRNTRPEYTHHAYAMGKRQCDLPSASADRATHAFIRSTELRKPTVAGKSNAHLVLFYGLPVKDMIVLALRQISDRVKLNKTTIEQWRIAFARSVHLVLSHVDVALANELAASSCLKTDQATCKGLANRATHFARCFNDKDYDRPAGAFFDYARWFDRDRDVEFWNRLQRSAKLYAAFGSSYIHGSHQIEREPLPRRQGRRPSLTDGNSRWANVMQEAKGAFDAYSRLFAKTQPQLLTAQMMTRVCEGYSSLASDPQFWPLFKLR